MERRENDRDGFQRSDIVFFSVSLICSSFSRYASSLLRPRREERSEPVASEVTNGGKQS